MKSIDEEDPTRVIVELVDYGDAGQVKGEEYEQDENVVFSVKVDNLTIYDPQSNEDEHMVYIPLLLKNTCGWNGGGGKYDFCQSNLPNENVIFSLAIISIYI